MKKTFFAILLASLVLVSGAACTATGEPSSSSSPSSSSNELAEATPDPTPEVTPEPTPEAQEVFSTGSEIALGDWAITVTGMDFAPTIPNGDYMEFTPEEGNQFLVVHISITNNGKESDTFLPSFSINGDVTTRVLYGDGYEFSSTSLLGYDKEMHDSALNPLSSKEGDIAFDVPQTLVDSTDPLFVAFSLDGEEVQVALR